MKLQEVAISRTKLEYPAGIIATVGHELLRVGKQVLDQGGYRMLKQSIVGGFRLGLFKGDELVGFAGFSEVTVHGDRYQELDGIYVVPAYRGSVAVGRMIYGLHALDIGPVILGSNEKGGFLFAGGHELLQAVLKRSIFKLSLLDLKTGERQPFDIEQLQRDHITLVLEDTLIAAAYHVYASTVRLHEVADRQAFAVTHDLLEGQL